MLNEIYRYRCDACGHEGDYAARLTHGMEVHCGAEMRVVSTRFGTLTIDDNGKLAVEEDMRRRALGKAWETL